MENDAVASFANCVNCAIREFYASRAFAVQKLASRALDANASLRGLRPSTPRFRPQSTGLMVPTTRHEKARLSR